MPEHSFAPLRGRIETFTLSSPHLKNLLGDPHSRTISAYLPENYEKDNKRYPVFMSLAGFTGSGLKHLAWNAFEETFPQRIERLIFEKKMGNVIVIFPDCFTSLGGNQYINSSAMGNWADYLNEDVLKEVDRRYRTISKKEARAVFGKSSGGYGALIFAMKYAQNWGGIACHSGDMDFDLLYKAEFPICLTKLASYKGSPATFLDSFKEKSDLSGSDFCTLMCLAMCATYAPNDKLEYGVELPVDKETCELNEELWKKWLEHDPLKIIDSKEKVRENLKSLKALFIDCGFRDQYHLHYGARKFKKKLEAYKIPHHYEEFDGTHSKINHRLDQSLPYLFKRLES